MPKHAIRSIRPRSVPQPLTPPGSDDCLSLASDDSRDYVRELHKINKAKDQRKVDDEEKKDESTKSLPHNEVLNQNYPTIFVTDVGTMSVQLKSDVSIDISVNRSLLISCMGHFSLFMCVGGGLLEVVHRTTLVSQECTNLVVEDMRDGKHRQVQCNIDGAMYTHENARVTWVARSADLDKGEIINLEAVNYAPIKNGSPIASFYKAADTSKDSYIDLCQEFVHRADHSVQSDYSQVVVNGYTIREYKSGMVKISHGKTVIRFVPDGRLQVKTAYIDFGITGKEESYFVFQNERVFIDEKKLTMAADHHVFQFDNRGTLISADYAELKPRSDPKQENVIDDDFDPFLLYPYSENGDEELQPAPRSAFGPYGDCSLAPVENPFSKNPDDAYFY